jgi:hypothetical protein
VEKQKEEREELTKVVKKLWEEDKRSMTDGFKLPLENYLHSMRKILSYKNQREKARDTAKKREDDARRIEEVRQRQIAHESRQTGVRGNQSADRDRRTAEVRRRSSEHRRRSEANVQSRQPSMTESLKPARGSRVICESDVEDE